MFRLYVNIYLFLTIYIPSAHLVNGWDSCSGRVELQYLSDWGSVCGDGWDMRAASVLCGQLKCGSAVAVLGADWFGEGSDHIWADVFHCHGNETHLSECPISSWSRTACSHKQDAGVICSSQAFHEGRVRLSGGRECEGQVEVYFIQDWRRVLLDSRSVSEASVICRQLGCGSVLNFSSSSPSSPEQHSHMCMMGFNCSGSEAHLGNCSSANLLNLSCSSREQLSITCSGHSSIRLVGSGGDCAGRLEVFLNGSWGTVCDDSWDIEDAQVVCRQLQCGVALSTHVPAWFGPGTGPIWLNEVQCDGSETSMWDCRYQLCGEDECGHQEDVGVVCSEMRLSEGCEGNLEFFYNGTWGNVCVNGMNEKTVSLVCRELNCGRTGSESPSRARVESSPNWLDQVKCRKHDSTLWHCPSEPWGQNDCDNHIEVAHITCSDHLPLRLRGAEGSCSGRLEIYHNAAWGSICDDQWDISDAEVVCRQLGCGKCGSAVAVLGADWFGEGSGRVWADVFDCHGNETHLSECPISSWSRTACSHKQDAGVICNGRVRLSGGRECEGQVEVYFSQDWRRVLLDSWSVSEASVVCRQLGCGSVLNFSSSSPSSPDQHIHMCVMGFNCSGSEAHLGNCSSAKLLNLSCSSREQLSITCSGMCYINPKHGYLIRSKISIRLVGSGGDCAGRLEVFLSGSWGTVCDDSWDIEDAQVVCRQLQCGVALSAHIPAWFGPGTGPIWLNEVQCEGNEISMWNCRYQLLVCSEFKEIRLTEGCEGNLEVFYNRTWGNVCENRLDEEIATLICQELNYGTSGSENNDKPRVESSPDWLDDLKCRKHDSTLWHCPSSSWGKETCSSNNTEYHWKFKALSITENIQVHAQERWDTFTHHLQSSFWTFSEHH
uniref:SRCR domain-containing protein n=1 Tax=Electrophorus electricus TaxID=8005 RepID=A0A4W4GFL8_ELEEL